MTGCRRRAMLYTVQHSVGTVQVGETQVCLKQQHGWTTTLVPLSLTDDICLEFQDKDGGTGAVVSR